MHHPLRRRRIASTVVALALCAVTAPAAWPATAAPVTGGAAKTSVHGDLVVIGDSLTEGASVFGSLGAKLRSTGDWSTVRVDYRRGRRTSDAYGLVSRILTGAHEPAGVVIALGTNDMISHSEPQWPARVIDSMMSRTLGLPVLWVNVSFDRTKHPDWKIRADRFNRALRTARTRWPNLYIADWSRGFVPAGRSRYIADGVHLSISGYRTRAAWIASQVETFSGAVYLSTTTTSTTSTTTTSIPASVPSPGPTTTTSTSTTSTTTTSTSTTTTSTTVPPG